MTHREETELLQRFARNHFGVVLHPSMIELARKKYRAWQEDTRKAGGVV